jgi:arabinose-5-phosphate isomerase
LNKISLKKISNNVLNIQINSIEKLKSSFDKNFEEIIEFLAKIKGRIIITGIGKSAIIGMKVSATLNSTGTPSIFMHGSDALHGDLGAITKDDVVICFSKSGNNNETIDLTRQIKKLNIHLIAITSNKESYLRKKSDNSIVYNIEKEACPNNLAPTTSTTIQLLIGDTIAICLMNLKDFKAKDFVKLHPSGSLGKRLTISVRDIIDLGNVPSISINSKFKNAIEEISSKMYGATAVLSDEKIEGIITDGDVRRILEKYDDPLNIPVSKLITNSPKKVDSTLLAIDALEIMTKNKITNLIVIKEEKYVGMIHIHDIIKIGL